MIRSLNRLQQSNRQLLDSLKFSARLSPAANMASSREQSGGAKSILNWVDPKDKSGEYKRQSSVFRNTISNEPGAEFPVEKDRYHLYVSYACPWAHRALIVRKLKGLEEFITFTSVHWHMDENEPGANTTLDPLHAQFTHLRQIYFDTDPNYSGRFTVPTLYDKKQKRIVNNESSEIIRMFYHVFDHIIPEKDRSIDLLPADLKADIDSTNEWTYNDINNGVYKSGFATTQDAYNKAVTQLFKSLDRAEAHLASSGPYYWGERLTETDVRLFTTIIRFDPVYVQHFKCNIRDIRSGYPHLHKWLRNLYWNLPAFHDTTEFTHIRKHYTQSHGQINQFHITPVGPLPDILPLDEEVAAVRAARGK